MDEASEGRRAGEDRRRGAAKRATEGIMTDGGTEGEERGGRAGGEVMEEREQGERDGSRVDGGEYSFFFLAQFDRSGQEN